MSLFLIVAKEKPVKFSTDSSLSVENFSEFKNNTHYGSSSYI